MRQRRYGYGTRRRYFKKVAAYKPRAFKSKYDDDAWIKCEHITNLIVQPSLTEFYSVARIDLATSMGGIEMSYMDTTEYGKYMELYAFAEVRGIRAEVTMGRIQTGGNTVIQGCEIYGGNIATLAPATVPDINRLQGLPQRQVVNTQGQMSSLYVNVNSALRSAGVEQSTAIDLPYPTTKALGVVVYGGCAGNWTAGDTIGQVRYTWYIRLHQRKYEA